MNDTNNEWVVEIEKDCWIAPWQGDPGRTLKIESATRYESGKNARIALGMARVYRTFKNAKVYPLSTYKK